jgi:hypothetical protein
MRVKDRRAAKRNRAPLFVAMTLVVFVPLSRKDAEVAIRYPEAVV